MSLAPEAASRAKSTSGFEAPARRRLGGLELLALALALAVAGALLFTDLGRESLLGDEALYAAVARDSLRAGHWFPLVYDDAPYSGKPPLWLWTIAASFRLLGVGELAARLPSTLAGLAAVALFAYALVRRHGALVSLYATVALVTGHHLLFRHGLRQAVFEGPLLLATVGLVLAATNLRLSSRQRTLALAGWSVFGAAIKGLAAPLFFATFSATLWVSGRRRLPAGFLRSALVALLAGVATWGIWLGSLDLAGVHAVAAAAERDVWTRVLSGVDPGHLQGPWYLFSVVRRELGLLLLLVPLALLPTRRGRSGGLGVDELPAWTVGLAWGVGPLCVYSLSASKLSWYIAPALPGIALLVGLGARGLQARSRRLHPVLGAVVLGLLLLPLGSRVAGRWRRITGPRPEQVTLRVLIEEARADPRAQLVLDVPGDEPSESLREWHWFYLGESPRLLFSFDADLEPGGCAVVVTSDPDRMAGRAPFAGAPPLPVHRVTEDEIPLFVVDGCGGEIVKRVAARAAG